MNNSGLDFFMPVLWAGYSSHNTQCYNYLNNCNTTQSDLASQSTLSQVQQMCNYTSALASNMRSMLNYTMNTAEPPCRKKILTWDELYKIAFPNDPIQVISQKVIKKIKEKYAWLDEYQ